MGTISQSIHISKDFEFVDRHDNLFTVGGIKRLSPFTMKLANAPREQLFDAYHKGVAERFEVVFPDGKKYVFNGFVTHLGDHNPVDGVRTLQVGIRPTGAPVVLREEEKKPVAKLKKVLNKFYVASPTVTTQEEQGQLNDPKTVRLAGPHSVHGGKWTRKDVAGAIEHARIILADNPAQDHVAIVKIVKIVRRKEAPITVENV